MVKELRASDIINYDNSQFLSEVFSEFENATLVKSNDKSVIMLDEENDVLYKANYQIDYDTEEVVFYDIEPTIIKEEVENFGSYVARAFDLSTSPEDSYGYILEGVKKVIHSLDGGYRQKLIDEARDKALKKKVDEGRKAILESLRVFKAENASTLKKLQVKDFYNKLLEKLNREGIEDAEFVVNERMLFERRKSTKYKMDRKSTKVRKIRKKPSRQAKQTRIAGKNKSKLVKNLKQALKKFLSNSSSLF